MDQAELKEEVFEVVDQDGNVCGIAPRSRCHRDPTLLHRASHVLLFNGKGELYLQKRALTKDIQPGKWDTSVGGHLFPGESYLEAAYRELQEELGIKERPNLIWLYDYLWRSEVESELIRTFLLIHDGEISFDRLEIEEGRFFSEEEIEKGLTRDLFTPNFREEFRRYKEWSLKSGLSFGLKNPRSSFKPSELKKTQLTSSLSQGKK
jgi:isopentenyl-diphosphate delta-isomerase type 1